ncbi:MAG: glutaminyl-peptide cyclotransferase, partial [Chloroflexota bacterium]
MAKRQKQHHSQQHRSAWGKGLIGLSVFIGLILIVIGFTTESSRQPVSTALVETASPTPTLTPTASPSPFPTLPPLPSASPTPIQTPGLIAPASPPVTPTPLLTNTVQVPVYGYRVINTYPHDGAAYTQGLVFVDQSLYEGTGRRGQSTLRKVELETGQVLQSLDLPPEFFGEGVVIFGDRIIQLTWKSRLGFVYDKTSFKLLQSFGYPTQGWGITHDGRRLIMSDGTSTLHFWDPDTLAEIGRVAVTDNGRAVPRLNELEYVRGEVFANIWQTDFIARIDPDTGRVVGWIDLTGLLRPEDRLEPVDVLNGIAYDAATDRLFVTGKLWP